MAEGLDASAVAHRPNTEQQSTVTDRLRLMQQGVAVHALSADKGEEEGSGEDMDENYTQKELTEEDSLVVIGFIQLGRLQKTIKKLKKKGKKIKSPRPPSKVLPTRAPGCCKKTAPGDLPL